MEVKSNEKVEFTKLWEKQLPKGMKFTFEVIGKESLWTQFSRIKCYPGSEKSLGQSIGEMIHVGPFTGPVKVSFKPYSRDNSGSVRDSVIKVVLVSNGVWTLYMEDGGGRDYNDYVVRVVRNNAKEELCIIEESISKIDKD